MRAVPRGPTLSNILQSATDLLQKALESDPPPPAILNALGPRLAQLTAISVDPSGDGIDRWIATLRSITNDDELHETLIVRAVQMRFPRLAEALTLLGIITYTWQGQTPKAFRIDRVRLRNLLSDPGTTSLDVLWGRVANLDDLKALQVLVLMLISAPKPLLALEYGQQGFLGLPLGGVPGVNSDGLIELVHDLVGSPLSLPWPLAIPLTLEEFKAMASSAAAGAAGAITVDAPAAPDFDKLRGLALEQHLFQAELAPASAIDLGNGWAVGFETAEAGDHRFRVQFATKGIDTTVPRGGDLSIFLRKAPADGNAALIGEPNGTHLAVKAVRLGVHLRTDGPLYEIGAKAERIEFVLKPDFLGVLSFGLNVPTLLRFESDLDVSYSQGTGLSGQFTKGLPGLSLRFAAPLNLKVGGGSAGVELDQVVTQLEARLETDGTLHFRALFRYGARAHLGPLGATMEGAGAWIGRWADGTGGLLPPDGIGLSLDAGPVSGGGFLKIVSEREFAGALQIKILGVGAFAYGLFKTLPNGDPSVVALIGIRLPLPGVQLGFGFAVSGFGGLVGINRRADTDRIRERLASGAAGEVLFNDDPVKNAPRLLGEMQQFFPDEGGIFLVGPTLQINWLSILKLDAGVFVELPGPRKIFIAGSARLVIGSEEVALVYLRMDFVGGIDLTKSLIFFDAALVNSHVLGIFRITGGVALRLAYGSNGYFLFTVGGFHPSFNPGAMELPRVARVGVSVSLGLVWLKQEMYLAITSNSFQLGSRVEAGIEIGPISAHGWFGFDALIQFKPFHFIATVDAGFDVEVEGVSLCSVRVEGQLTGPGPLVLQARASVRLLFIKVSGSVTIELSSNPPEAVIAIPDLPDHLRPELINPDNLRMEGDDPSVIVELAATGAVRRFAPVGELIWEQKRAPLNLAIEKVEGVDLGGWHTLVATADLPGATPEDDWFGVGTYLKLADADALNTSRFARQQSGLRIGAGAMGEGDTIDAEIKLVVVKLPKRIVLPLVLGKLYVGIALSSMLGERTGNAKVPITAALVAVTQETWNTHGTDGAQQNTVPQNEIQAYAAAKQFGGVTVPAAAALVDLAGVA
jgi:uncharacterized protein DUF6603